MTPQRRQLQPQANLNDSAKELVTAKPDNSVSKNSNSMASEQATASVRLPDDTKCFTWTMTRRRWHRHKVDVPIRVIVHAGGTTRVFDGRGNELSDGGMALTAWAELQSGGVVDIEFTPPYSSSPIRITGTIRNRTGYRYGVEFLTRSDQETQRADRLLLMLTSM